ncbi:4'-phosphopantetheinyl transferase family protein [Rhizobium sp. RAF56]|uniref:4'-phosphopantetheinyl transferase family protein n=1 Tax=Rhizobium sp. RAF56 TaxID=3233062 RepID=UPI003F9A473B
MTLPADFSTRKSEEASLATAIAAIAPKGIRVGCRIIREGDEAKLLPDEARSITSRHVAARRASGAARWIAHRLLAELGVTNYAVLRTASGAPMWPGGVTGSLAHDERMALAAVAPAAEIDSLGIDVEPATPLPDDIVALVATEAEMSGMGHQPLSGRLLFSIKEAVYKAVYPIDRLILEYEDITVDLNTGQAMTKTNHAVRLAYCLTPRIVALAYIPA